MNMIFNGTNFSEYVKIEDIRKALLPPITNILKKIPGRRGSKYIRNELGEKHIEIDIRLIEDTKEEVRKKVRQLAGMLYTAEPKKLISYETDKYDMAILDGRTDFERLAYTGFSTLRFLCPDPLAYGQTRVIDIPNTIYNTGTHSTTGKITVEITETTNDIKLTLQNTGEFVYVSHDFVVGDTILIDLEEETVHKNGYSIMADCYLESDFFEIPVGEFEVTVSTGNATLEFIERWL